MFSAFRPVTPPTAASSTSSHCGSFSQYPDHMTCNAASAPADMQHRILISSYVHPPPSQNTTRCTEGMWELRDDRAREMRGETQARASHVFTERNTPEVGSVTLLYASLVAPQWAASARIDPRPPRGEGDKGPTVSKKQDTARSSVTQTI